MKQSAGMLVYRQSNANVEVLLVHPGGPFWAKKDSWSIPKGELEPNEDLLSGAQREFAEEVGAAVPTGEPLSLSEAKQSGGKVNYMWAIEGEVDLRHFSDVRPNNIVKMEWPPRSGKQIEFAENDRAEWFTLAVASRKVFKNQAIFIERLAGKLGVDLTSSPAPKTDKPEQQTLL